MLIARLYADHLFDTTKKALDLFGTLERHDAFVALSRFGAHEPLRMAYDKGNLHQACELLVGGGRSGDILLKGSKHKFLCWIRWRSIGVSEWVFWVDDKVLQKPALTHAFMGLLHDLVSRYHVIFGGVATEAEWHAKNWKVSEDESTEMKLGLDGIDRKFFPGLYWVTIFGKRITVPNIRQNAALRPFLAVFGNDDHATTIVTTSDPFDFNNPERKRCEAAIRAVVGSEHFFDLHDLEKTPMEISY
ncbi:MAG: hypothetical protein KIT10_15770 [Flavobacteriales bacterium]|nr:hypothetical protein [Flavobacteriales bacterium]